MKIKNYLCKYHEEFTNIYNHEVLKIVENSKDAVLNSVFVAIKGYHHHGIEYINEAITKGAKTIIYDVDIIINDKSSNINYLKVNDAKVELARLLSWFYQKRSKPQIIAVTGTNGKTSVTTYVFNILKKMHFPCLLLGTEGNISYFDGTTRIKKALNTTPSITYIYEMMFEYPYKYLIMEASSQGISESRLLGLKYQVVCFTNISQDHLDYHHTLDNYAFAKARIIYDLVADGTLILNKDMNYFDRLKTLSLAKTITYSSSLNDANISGEIIEKTIKGMLLKIKTKHNEYICKTKLIGGFNLDNVLASIAILWSLGLNKEEVVKNFMKIEAVKGRMNVYKIAKKTVVIDFAHTPDGLHKVLTYFNELKSGKIITVIGCGGMRDQSKRAIMGKIACDLSDCVIFTEDNSRDEDVKQIIAQMVSNVNTNNYMIEISRKLAINKALDEAADNDIICILGKGSESKIIAKNITPFSDIDYIKSLGGKKL